MLIACYLHIVGAFGVLLLNCFVVCCGVTVVWLIVLLFSTRYRSGVLLGWIVLRYALWVVAVLYVLLIVWFLLINVW